MTARPSLVCPRCGGLESVAVSIDGTVVVRRCWCGQEFDVDLMVPPEPVRVAS